MVVNVALAQICPETGNTEANIATFVDYLDRAAEEGAQLVIFPELALTGYGCGDRFFAVAEEVPGPTTERLTQEAQKRGQHVLWGMPERGLPGIIYNSAVLVGPEGYIGTWRKHTLPGHATDTAGPGAFPDRRFFRAGSRSAVFPTAIGRIGMMVCYDIFFPEIARLLTLQGADLLVGISGSPAFERPIFETLIRARAMENAIWFAYCNMAGEEAGIQYWGGSRIIAPGNYETKVPGDPVVVQAPYNEEALVCCTVDYAWTEQFRPFFPILRDLRAEMYKQLSDAVQTSLE
jgi:predicted amidohydrolase